MKSLVPLMICAAFSLLPSQTACAIPSEDEKLQAFFRDYLDETFRLQPTQATTLGDHRFDERMDDISVEARAGWLALIRRTFDQLPERVDVARLSTEGRVDYAMWRDELAAARWMTEYLRPFEHDPRTYARYLSDGIYALLVQSSLPKEQNIANAIARMRELPRIVAEAKRTLTRPPLPVLETSIVQNRGAVGFYEREIFAYVGDTPQAGALRAAAAVAVDALRDYQGFLEGPLKARATPEWRLGREKFGVKFALETGVEQSAEQNLADAEAEFARLHDELYVVARQLWPRCCPGRTFPPDDADGRRETVTRVITAVNQEHGTAESMLSDVKDTVTEIRSFINQRDYLRLPEPDRCAVIEMPEFRRGNSLAYLENAPPLDPEAPSYYAVSPPPADWSEAQKRSFLEEYNAHMLKILTIHEAYPGHYVQLAYANGHPSLIRRVLQSGSTIEGWAVYGEVAMLNEGYGDGDPRLRLMQLKFYLRAVANSILDYRMHCTDMSDTEATRFLTEGAYQSEGEARLKIIRAKQSSVQLSTYFVGRMAQYRLRQAVAREQGAAFDLGRYHEAVLSVGSVAPKYLPELVRLRLSRPR